jgi:hypothetical protein
MHWDPLIDFMLSSVLTALTRFTRRCSGLMMCFIHLDESTTRVESCTTVTSLCTFSEQLDGLLDCLDNRCTMHSFKASLLIAGVGNETTHVTVVA